MSSLKQVASGIHERRQEIVPTSQLHRVAFEDGSVSVTLSDEIGSKIRLSIVYTDADSYPASGALLLCEDSTYEGKIAALAERFQDKAPLGSILSKVLIRSCWEETPGSTLNLPHATSGARYHWDPL